MRYQDDNSKERFYENYLLNVNLSVAKTHAELFGHSPYQFGGTVSNFFLI